VPVLPCNLDVMLIRPADFNRHRCPGTRHHAVRGVRPLACNLVLGA
jgi:hypothetical protein